MPTRPSPYEAGPGAAEGSVGVAMMKCGGLLVLLLAADRRLWLLLLPVSRKFVRLANAPLAAGLGVGSLGLAMVGWLPVVFLHVGV